MTEYKIVSELGRGGMGVVYRAVQQPLGREVALKVLLGNIKERPDLYKRFQREIGSCIRLNHPGIIKILDAGELDGRPFYAMEYLKEARPLDEVIRSEAPFRIDRAFDVTFQLLDALDYCHAHDFVHRDMKPANVMVGPDARVTLMDFGLVKDLNATVLTQEGHVIGTPRYIAPEVFKGKPQGPGVDLWAIGAILYEMLTARRAFPGETTSDMVQQIIGRDPVPIASCRSDLPPSIDTLVCRFLARDPAQRVDGAPAGRRELEAWLEQNPATGQEPVCVDPGTLAPETGPGQAIDGRSPSGARGDSPATPRATRRVISRVSVSSPPPARPWPVIAAAVLAIGIGAVVWIGRSTSPPSSPTATASPGPASRIADVRFAPLADGVAVTFESEGSEVFGVRTAVWTNTGAGAPWLTWESTPTRSHRIRVMALKPGTAYRFEVVDKHERALAQRDVTTLTPREVASRLRSSLRELAPRTLAKSIGKDLELSLGYRHGRSKQERERLLGLFRKKWQPRIRDAILQAHLPESGDPFSRLKESVFAGGSIGGAEKRELFEAIDELHDLEDLAGQIGIPCDRWASRLVSARYGQIRSPSLHRPRGVGFVLERNDAVTYQELGAFHPLELVYSGAGEDAFRAYSDPRDEVMDSSILAHMARADFLVPKPLALPSLEPDAPLEFRCAVDNMRPSNPLRILIGAKLVAARSAWRHLATLRVDDASKARYLLCHTIPADVLPDRPFYVRIELAFSYASAILGQELRQDGKLKWLVFTWPPKRQPDRSR